MSHNNHNNHNHNHNSSHNHSHNHGSHSPSPVPSHFIAESTAELCTQAHFADEQAAKDYLEFYVNGVKVIEKQPDPSMTLLTYLRTKLLLTGTKLGCGEGGCGACTVMVSRYDQSADKIIHRSVNACLAPVCAMDGLAVTTVEGIGSTATKLHPVQERIAKSHGSQCGFCTPGIVMSMYTLLRNTPKPTAHEVEDAFQGNLCRCTGYRPILDAFKTFCVESSPATDSHMANGNQDSALLASTINSTAVPSNNSSSATDSGSIAPSTFECPMGEACCKNNKDKQNDCSTMTDVHGLKSHQYKEGDRLTVVGHSALTRGLVFTPFDPSQEPIFPPAFKNAAHPTYKKCLKVVGEHVTWFRPTTLASLLELKRHHPHARLVVGNTEIGIETKFKHQVYKHLFHTSYLPELNIFKVSQDGVHVGASVCLTDFGAQLTQLVSTLPSYKTRTFTAILENLRWFAGHQIRNVGCVGGNIVTASPISDLNPVFMAANSVLTVASAKNGERQIPFSEFYKSYRRTALEHDEVLVSVFIPFTKQYEYVEAFKQAKRREDDIAIVNAGMRVRLKFLPLSCLTPSTASSVSSTPTSTNDTTEELVPVIEELAVSYGGMAPTTVLSKSTSQALVGKVFDESIVPVACETLASDLPLATSAPGGMIEYRRALSTSFFFKFYLMVVDSLKQDLLKNVATTTTSSTTNTTTTTTTAAIIADGAAAANPRYRVPSLTNTQKSAIERVHRPTSSSIQEYQVPLQVEHEHDQVGTPVQHLSAEKQATGEAVYVDDIPRFSNELYAGIVFSQRAHAKILSVNTSAALKIDGVFAYYGAKDVPGSNKFPIVAEDEVCFADGVVTCVGQIIGVVLATTQAIAQYAARQVVVEYQELKPIVTIEDAIEAESFYSPINKFEVGNVEEALANSPVVIEGEFKMGGQEHFYLETQASLAIPHREDGELEIYASTQNPNKTQMTIAKVLGVNASKINCRTKRAGGGFGGKETRSVLVSAVCAVAAHLSKRPVRCMLDRDEDMTSSGQRHPFMARYKVGADKDGILKALDLKMYSNGGNTLDLSMSVMERALFSLDNVYNIPVLRGMGYVCKTNLPSYTAFRGFGAPQGMAIVETWMTHLASVLGLDNNTIRERNFYKEGDLTHFKQALVDCHVQKTWNIALQNSRFATRRAECDKFNSENRWKKRGLAIIPTKFGISFTAKFLNQAGALVHIYTDGSVLVTHGGIEMGQGLHTKMIQVAAKEFGIPMSQIHIAETATNTVPNTSPTAASAGSDLNGMAVQNACEILNRRLQPYKDANPNGTFGDWVRSAYFDRISLSATGFYMTPNIGYDFSKHVGTPFAYLCYGASVAEIEIDTLTGDFMTRHATCVMDVGHSLNPAIDIGQVEGAFVQGIGLFTLEESHWSPKGVLFTRGPGMYKIPGFGDIPLDFRVHLLKNEANPKALHSSKAVGEPPLFLAASVFFAIRDAIKSARDDANLTGYFRLDSPATAERIRMGCEDQFTDQFPRPPIGDPSYKNRWNVVV